MTSPFRLTVLISGTGSNLAAIIEAAKGCSDFAVTTVISNNSSAPGLQFAKAAGIPTASFERERFATLSEQKSAILEAVKESRPDLIALAGFMMVLQPAFMEAFPGRIINIHPSLLPKFPGLDTHARVLEAKEKAHGTSVHFVDAGVDTGALIAQASVEITATDTAVSLKERVQAEEYKLYPWVILHLARGEISLTESGVKYAPSVLQESAIRGYKLFGRVESVKE